MTVALPAAPVKAPAWTSGVSSARGHRAWSSRGGPGRSATTQLPARTTSAGAVPARPTMTAPSGTVACLRTPGGEIRVRTAKPFRRRARALLDLPFEVGNSHQIEARPRSRGAPPSGRRASARARLKRREGRARGRRARRVASSSGASPTTVIRVGSIPSEKSARAKNGPFASVRSPRTSSDPVTTTAARGSSPGAKCWASR